MELKELGILIKQLRKKQKMTQDELAKLSGYSNRSAIARIENGEIDLPESKITSISKALGVPTHTLFGIDTPTTPSIDHCSIDDVSDEEFYLVEHKGEMIKFYIKKLSPEERIELTNNKKGALAFNDKVSEEDMNLLENVLSEMYLKNKLGK